MDTKKIRFVSNRPWLTGNSASRPAPILKTLPDWYRNADWFVPDPKTGKPAEAPDGSGKMPQFLPPRGYHAKHFAWWADWAVELPEGYSALYTHPLNRFELPFLTTSGVVDNDKVSLPGTMPFFVFKGVRGILPAGTPYAQIIPFKREHWESAIEVSSDTEAMIAKNKANSAKYRKPDGGVYQREVWERRKYQ